MIFNSFEFLLFLPIVFVLFWFAKKHLTIQNWLLVAASYFFYGWWDWKFLALIIISSTLDYCLGLAIDSATSKRKQKWLLGVSIAANLGILGFFKYFNFFIDSFITAFSSVGIEMNEWSLNIILPVGISFYTFQTLSYTIDVYRKKIRPTKDVAAFFAFVSFFPQLVAGPIERATNLLPQFQKTKSFNYAQAVDGARQALWGFFKKIVIADNCAYYANEVFANSADASSIYLVFGALMFTFQIYCDFSGYSDIAIGISKFFGFNLKRNFAFPYFSRDIAEFWRRWHISLSTWFRDYLYIPLGGSKGSKLFVIRNVFIIFVVSGFWHGANWTFVAWGFLNALYFIPVLLLNRNRSNLDVVAKNKLLPSFKEFFQMTTTFLLVVLAWIFFRADSISHAGDYLISIFSFQAGSYKFMAFDLYKGILVSGLVVLMLFFEWVFREREFGLEIAHKSALFRRIVYAIVILLIAFFGRFAKEEFIYFQF